MQQPKAIFRVRAIPACRKPELFFLYIFFWRARVCRPPLRMCRLFTIFEGCPDSNPECCRIASRRATDLTTHPSKPELIGMLKVTVQGLKTARKSHCMDKAIPEIRKPH
jgi:hypothetical protein